MVAGSWQQAAGSWRRARRDARSRPKAERPKLYFFMRGAFKQSRRTCQATRSWTPASRPNIALPLGVTANCLSVVANSDSLGACFFFPSAPAACCLLLFRFLVRCLPPAVLTSSLPPAGFSVGPSFAACCPLLDASCFVDSPFAASCLLPPASWSHKTSFLQ